MAAPPLDGDAGGLLVLRHDVAHLLRVELRRERRRADEVAEEDRELPALALGRGRLRLGNGRRSRSARGRGRQPGSLGAFDAPQAAQTTASGAPDAPQKRRSELLSWSQDGQRIPSNPPLRVSTTTEAKAANTYLAVCLPDCPRRTGRLLWWAHAAPTRRWADDVLRALSVVRWPR
jgi:hypothetical protein